MPRLIAASSLTKNQTGRRDPEMSQSKKGRVYRLGQGTSLRFIAAEGHEARSTRFRQSVRDGRT